MRHCTPLNQAAAMWKLSGQSDPDPQRYLRQTQTEIPCFYREMSEIIRLPRVHIFIQNTLNTMCYI